MPYPNYHSARITSPEKNYLRIRTVKMKGVDGILQKIGVLPKAKEGPRGGRTETQAYWFDKLKFTVAQAKKWLKDHDIKFILFEPAKEAKTEAIAVGKVSVEEFKSLVEKKLTKILESIDDDPENADWLRILRKAKKG